MKEENTLLDITLEDLIAMAKDHQTSNTDRYFSPKNYLDKQIEFFVVSLDRRYLGSYSHGYIQKDSPSNGKSKECVELTVNVNGANQIWSLFQNQFLGYCKAGVCAQPKQFIITRLGKTYQFSPVNSIAQPIPLPSKESPTFSTINEQLLYDVCCYDDSKHGKQVEEAPHGQYEEIAQHAVDNLIQKHGLDYFKDWKDRQLIIKIQRRVLDLISGKSAEQYKCEFRDELKKIHDRQFGIIPIQPIPQAIRKSSVTAPALDESLPSEPDWDIFGDPNEVT